MFRSTTAAHKFKTAMIDQLKNIALDFTRNVPLTNHFPNVATRFQSIADAYNEKREKNPKPYKTHDLFKQGYTPAEKKAALVSLMALINGTGNVTELELAILRNGSLGRKLRAELDACVAERPLKLTQNKTSIHEFVEFLRFYHYNTPLSRNSIKVI